MNQDTGRNRFEVWNRKVHIYLGLYMILFLWLFSVSGLLMNHPKWFPHKVDRTPSKRSVTLSGQTNQVALAKEFRDQLGLKGEIILRAQRKTGHLVFMVMRPDLRFGIDVDLASGTAVVNRVTTQPTGILEQLHTFTGVRGIWNEPVQERDWIVTRIWSLSMDALCVGVILVVLSSLYMGFRVTEHRRWAVASFVLGVLVCSCFVWGLAATG